MSARVVRHGCSLGFWGIGALIWSVGGPAAAQTPFVFKLSKEVQLRYEVRQDTSVTVGNLQKFESTATKVRQLRQWDVVDVDAFGEATLELSLVKLRLEQTEPNGKQFFYDSAKPEGSRPELVDQLGKLLDRPLVRTRITRRGIVKSTKSLTEDQGFARDLPFQISVPDEFPSVGLEWTREFAITLGEPLGAGQGYKAIQRCRIDAMDEHMLKISFITQLAEEVKSHDERIALVQFQPKGTVTLDRKRGLMVLADLAIDQKTEHPTMKGVYYHFQTRYLERLVEDHAPQASRKP